MSSPIGYPQGDAYPMFSATSAGDVPVAVGKEKTPVYSSTSLDGVVAIFSGNLKLPLSATAQSAVPVILVPSGAFTDAAGNFTLGTALSVVPNGVIPGGGNAYIYLPAGAGGLAGGTLYAATFSSVTAGQVVGVATSATAWTQTTGIVTLVSIPVAGGAMGPNGSLAVEVSTSNNNSAGSKTVRAGLNVTTGALVAATTTVAGSHVAVRVQNRGAENKNVSSSASGSFGAVGAGVQWSVDTSQNWAFKITGQLVAATDWVSVDAFSATVTYGG